MLRRCAFAAGLQVPLRRVPQRAPRRPSAPLGSPPFPSLGGRRSRRSCLGAGAGAAAQSVESAQQQQERKTRAVPRVDLGQRIAYYEASEGPPLVASDFDFVCDARSQGEYAEDHVIGALSTPVLSDEERAQVGTIYKQQSPFEARRLGAALVSQNVARILMEHFQGTGSGARVLVYCWRGGDRSLSLAHTLSRVGFDVHLMRGGWKAYRARVREELGRLGRFDLRLVRGVTGCQKTVLLQKLRDLGAQVVDLEGAADHKGSILGVNVDAPQPSQKLFESRLADEVARFDDSRPVFIEGESSLVGQRTVPSALLHSMRKAGSLLVEAPMDVRVDFIRQDYKYFEGRAVDELKERLQRLRQLRGGATVDRWLAQVEAGEWDVFVEDMLVSHYDPAYEDAARRDWEGTVLETVHIGAVGDAALEAAARELLERHDPAALAA